MEKSLPTILLQRTIDEKPFIGTEFAEAFDILRSTGLDKLAMSHQYISDTLVRHFYKSFTFDFTRVRLAGVIRGSRTFIGPREIGKATGVSSTGSKRKAISWESDESITIKKKLRRRFGLIKGFTWSQTQAYYDGLETSGFKYWDEKFCRSQLEPVPYLLSAILHEVLQDDHSSSVYCSHEIMSIIELMLKKEPIDWANLLFSKLVDSVNSEEKSYLKMGRLITAVYEHLVGVEVADKTRFKAPVLGWSAVAEYVEMRNTDRDARKRKREQEDESKMLQVDWTEDKGKGKIEEIKTSAEALTQFCLQSKNYMAERRKLQGLGIAASEEIPSRFAKYNLLSPISLKRLKQRELTAIQRYEAATEFYIFREWKIEEKMEKRLKELDGRDLSLDERISLREEFSDEVCTHLARTANMSFAEVKNFQPSVGNYVKGIVEKTRKRIKDTYTFAKQMVDEAQEQVTNANARARSAEEKFVEAVQRSLSRLEELKLSRAQMKEIEKELLESKQKQEHLQKENAELRRRISCEALFDDATGGESLGD